MADVENIHEKSTEPDLPYYLNDYGIIGNDLLPSEDIKNEGTNFYILCDIIIFGVIDIWHVSKKTTTNKIILF